ncbi:Mss4-like protein [Mycena leptocephala]|nr:Mss4-like protein [Mycena leptocephala]KAJ7899373.1 Mss4-like protein [Mycena leptocephala]KAJ7918053.1 Mss4-like protein [Mycena leptocephala]
MLKTGSGSNVRCIKSFEGIKSVLLSSDLLTIYPHIPRLTTYPGLPKLDRNMATTVEKTEDEWRAILTHEQFRVIRQKGTEEKFTGEYDKHFEQGVYSCMACSTPLYKSTTKFDVRP